MDRTKEDKGITMISLVVIVSLLFILAAVSITTIREQKILPMTKNAINEYNVMAQNQQNEMEGNRVLEILDLDE